MQVVQNFVTKNGLECTLRPAMPEDAKELIATVSSTSLERSYILMEKYGKDEATERQYITDMNPEANLLLVAVAQGAVIGSLAALQADGGYHPATQHLLKVGIHIQDAYRGHGIGTEMLRYAKEWARKQGFKKMEANIFTVNQRSLNLFRHAGFLEEGTRKKRYRIGSRYIDEVIMANFLNNE